MSGSVSSPGDICDVTGALRVAGANVPVNAAAGHVVTSDAQGNLSLQPVTAGQVGGGAYPSFVAPKVVPLAQAGGLVAVDMSLGNVFRLTLTASGWTLSNPVNVTDGQPVEVDLIQGAGGGFTIGYGSAWDFGAAGAPTLSTAAGKVDCLVGRWCAAANGGAGAVVVAADLGH